MYLFMYLLIYLFIGNKAFGIFTHTDICGDCQESSIMAEDVHKKMSVLG